jgi:hypothetical protein
MALFDYAELTVEEKAKRDLPLPYKLNIYDIVNLWITTDRDKEIYYDILNRAYNDGKGSLRATKKYKNPCTQDDENGTFMLGPYIFYQNIYIAVDAFLGWLKNEGEPRPTGCLLDKWWQQLELEPQAKAIEADGNNERELTTWLRQTWIDENKPGGSVFFAKLRNHVNRHGSPIVDHYTTGKKGAGIRWNTGSSTNDMTKKAIQNAVSKFRKTS